MRYALALVAALFLFADQSPTATQKPVTPPPSPLKLSIRLVAFQVISQDDKSTVRHEGDEPYLIGGIWASHKNSSLPVLWSYPGENVLAGAKWEGLFDFGVDDKEGFLTLPEPGDLLVIWLAAMERDSSTQNSLRRVKGKMSDLFEVRVRQSQTEDGLELAAHRAIDNLVKLINAPANLADNDDLIGQYILKLDYASLAKRLGDENSVSWEEDFTAEAEREFAGFLYPPAKYLFTFELIVERGTVQVPAEPKKEEAKQEVKEKSESEIPSNTESKKGVVSDVTAPPQVRPLPGASAEDFVGQWILIDGFKGSFSFRRLSTVPKFWLDLNMPYSTPDLEGEFVDYLGIIHPLVAYCAGTRILIYHDSPEIKEPRDLANRVIEGYILLPNKSRIVGKVYMDGYIFGFLAEKQPAMPQAVPERAPPQ